MNVKELKKILDLYDDHANIRFRLGDYVELSFDTVVEDDVPLDPCGGIIIGFGHLVGRVDEPI